MTLPRRVTDVEARRARALAHPTRRAILERLRRTTTDVRALAADCGLHPNAVRQHLSVLGDAGLTVEEVDRSPGQVGRPRRVYRAAEGTVTHNPFERLAGLLADVAAGADPFERGRTEGAALAARHDVTGGGEDPAGVVVRIASTHGFAVTVDRTGDGPLVSLGNCPYAAIASPVVCTLHHGIVEGAARAAGGAVTRFDVADPAIRPCEVVLAPTTGVPS